MKAIVTVQMDNAAFSVEDETGEVSPEKVSGRELAEVLRRLVYNLEEDNLTAGDTFHAIDSNGNTVGKLEITDD